MRLSERIAVRQNYCQTTRVVWLLLTATLLVGSEGFAIQRVSLGQRNSIRYSSWKVVTRQSASSHRSASRVERDEDSDDDRDAVPVRRRQRRRESSYEHDDRGNYLNDNDDDDDDYYTAGSLFDEDDDDYEEEEDEEDNFYDFDLDEDRDLFEDVLIPNPLLDSIDPDGAAERFPELARDPRFWFDMVLFIAFLNFLSAVGPQDPFPEIPIG